MGHGTADRGITRVNTIYEVINAQTFAGYPCVVIDDRRGSVLDLV